MRKIVGNEKGIALVTALMFTLICLGMVAALMQMLLTSTKLSASQKSYKNSLEASYGGTQLITREIIPKLFSNYSTGIGPLLTEYATDGAMGDIDLSVNVGLKTKLNTATASWGSLSKTLDPKDVPDLQFTLRGSETNTNYKVYAKIVDTVPGNSDTTGVDFLDAGAGVAGSGSGISPKHNPVLYSLEIRGERAANPKEKALLSVLYAY